MYFLTRPISIEPASNQIIVKWWVWLSIMYEFVYKAHVIQFINIAEGLIHSVQLLCQLLSTIEPLTVSEAMHDLQQITLLLFNATRDSRSSDIFSPPMDAIEVCAHISNTNILCRVEVILFKM